MQDDTKLNQKRLFTTGSLPLGSNAWAATLGGIVLLVCIAAGALISHYGRGLFSGIDGTRWLMPYMVWMGFAAGIVCVLFPPLYRKWGSPEALFAFSITVLCIASIAFIAFQRLSAGVRPFESFSESQAVGFAREHFLYPDSEKSPIGTLYTPLFILLSGLLHIILPGTVAYGRLISLAATMGSCIVVYKTVKLYRGPVAGLWGAALFSSTYPLMGHMYDWTLVDPLLMFLVALAGYFFLQNTERKDVAALFFAGMACFTKQTAALPFAVIMAGMLLSRRSIRAWWPLLFWLLVAAVLIGVTRGRAWEYLVINPMHHAFRNALPLNCLQPLFLLQIPLWIGFLIFLCTRQCLRPAAVSNVTTVRFGVFFFAVLFSSIIGIWKAGGYINALFPVEPLLCSAAAIGFYRLQPLIYLQLFIGIYNPFSTLYPWGTIRAADRQIVARAREVSGDVWLPGQSYLADAIDKPVWEHYGALESYSWIEKPVPRRLLNALEEHRIKRIIMRTDIDEFFKCLDPEMLTVIDKRYEKTVNAGYILYEARSELSY